MAPVESTPHPHATVLDPLANAKFSLNSLGVAGFFGGDIAVNGMATVIFFIGRRFVGLYNAPGSLEVAKRYGQLASSRVYRGLFPGGDTTDPAQLFGLAVRALIRRRAPLPRCSPLWRQAAPSSLMHPRPG